LGSSNVYYLIAANVVSGFGWSGFGLSAVNFVYDASEPGRRTKQIALFNATDGVACCIGSLIGGYLAPHLPALFGYQMRSLFTVSGVLRGIVVLLLLRQIVEVRQVSKMSFSRFLLGRF
jgi:MFS family permease